MFQRYEDEFGELASEIGQRLKKVEAEPRSRDDRVMTADDTEEELDRVEDLLAELRTVTRSMEMGKRDVPSAERAACERRLLEYQTDLERLGAEARRVRKQSTQQQGRAELLGSHGQRSEEEKRRAGQTSNLMDVAERGRSSLQRSMAQLEQTSAQGVATIENLRGQREQLERSHHKLKVADGNIDVRTQATPTIACFPGMLLTACLWLQMSHQVLKRMQKRAFMNNLIRYATIGILVLGIGLLLYDMFT